MVEKDQIGARQLSTTVKGRGLFFMVGLAVGAVVTGSLLAGTLEPPPDAVDAGGSPAPTMKTLAQIPRTWDQILPANDGEADGCNSSRFTCVLGGLAVRDNETGLVWEKSPDTTTRRWDSATIHCGQREVGGRRGFHLPMREQLASLLVNNFPGLPAGHPFQNVSTVYWSATTAASNPTFAWATNFSGRTVFLSAKTQTNFVWCVRGGQSFDGNTHSTLH